MLFRHYSGKTAGRRGYGFPLMLEDACRPEKLRLEERRALDMLFDDARINHQELCFCLLDDAQAEGVASWAKAKGIALEWGEDGADADYIYERTSLEAMSGARYSRKRNWIRRFEREFPGWEYQAISEHSIDDVRFVAHEWFREREADGREVSHFERDRLFEVLAEISHLPVFGGLVYVGPGVPAAFALGSMTSRRVCDLHYEKGLSRFVSKGVIPLLNREFARNSCIDGCEEINFEEDLGIEGLRRMKLSYFPREILRKRYAKAQLDA